MRGVNPDLFSASDIYSALSCLDLSGPVKSTTFWEVELGLCGPKPFSTNLPPAVSLVRRWLKTC